MSRCLWLKCRMQCDQSYAILFMHPRLHRKSKCCLSWTSKTYENLLLFRVAWFTSDVSHFITKNFSGLDPPINVCSPSPCGPYSICREVKGHAVCSCQPNYIGAPPNCRPECIVSSECALDKACVNQRCIDPCPGTCGQHARCQVVNHSPVCSCPSGYTGDPFVRCVKERNYLSFIFQVERFHLKRTFSIFPYNKKKTL